jgi:hypothetical protein
MQVRETEWNFGHSGIANWQERLGVRAEVLRSLADFVTAKTSKESKV